MLRPAQLYIHELQQLSFETFYRPEYVYIHHGVGEFITKCEDNNFAYHQFVSIDKDNKVIGYIAYEPNWISKSACCWKIISYDIGNLLFAKDIYQAVCDCFEKFNFNRIEFMCYADNPAIRGYRNFIKKYGGRECGYFRQDTVLKDGKLHDTVAFEIMADEFRK